MTKNRYFREFECQALVKVRGCADFSATGIDGLAERLQSMGAFLAGRVDYNSPI